MEAELTWLERGVLSGSIEKHGGVYYVKPAHEEKAAMFTSTAALALKETLEALIKDDLDESPHWPKWWLARAEPANDVADVCECGSGSNLRGQGHSDWCPCFEAA